MHPPARKLGDVSGSAHPHEGDAVSVRIKTHESFALSSNRERQREREREKEKERESERERERARESERERERARERARESAFTAKRTNLSPFPEGRRERERGRERERERARARDVHIKTHQSFALSKGGRRSRFFPVQIEARAISDASHFRGNGQ